MNPTLITDLLTYALPSGFLAGTVTWLVSRRKRRNDMLADMQRSIDLLCEKYNDVLQENVTLRREKADWLVAQQELLRKIDKLTREVEGLRKNFNRKTQKKPMKPPRRKKRPVLLPLLLLTAAGCATTRTTTQTSDIQTRIHSERSVEKSQRDSLVRQLRQQQQESDSTSRTLLIATESLPTDRTRLAIPLKDLERLPPGAAYTARSGRAAIRAEKQDDSLIVTGISDRAERRTWLLTNQTFRRQRQSDSLASHTGLRNLSSFARDTTLLRETHASTTRKKSSGNLFRTLFTGIALGILLTVVFRKTGVWAAIRRFLKTSSRSISFRRPDAVSLRKLRPVILSPHPTTSRENEKPSVQTSDETVPISNHEIPATVLPSQGKSGRLILFIHYPICTIIKRNIVYYLCFISFFLFCDQITKNRIL